MNKYDLKKLFPNCSQSFLRAHGLAPDAPVAPRLPRDESQPLGRKKLLGAEKTPGEGAGRIGVIITRCSTHFLDRDNLGKSAKAILDALRYDGRIPGDTERDIDLVCLQRKVKRAERGTLIELIYP